MFFAENGDRPDVPDAAILITQGASSLDQASTVPAAILARNLGIYLIVVGVGGMYNLPEMYAIASLPTNETVLTVSSWKLLPNITDQLLDDICPGERMMMILYEGMI